MTPEISLIICTKNRAISLNRCLQSINQQEIIEASGELIIVNNGSTDNTDEILREFKNKSLFSLKIINEAKQGLGRARNAGILAAEGKIIAFTDDDCYPAAGYFKNVISAFATGEFYYCGGRILLYDKTDSTYGCNYSLTREIIAPYSFIPAGIIQGANMVIDRKLVDEIGVFDPMFGAGTSFRCEDIDYCAKASMSGFVGAHVPELVVYHHHGRKPGKDIQKLQWDNDYARGAYYMKYMLKGKYKYYYEWLKLAKSRFRIQSTIREILGALHYLFALTTNRGN